MSIFAIVRIGLLILSGVLQFFVLQNALRSCVTLAQRRLLTMAFALTILLNVCDALSYFF